MHKIYDNFYLSNEIDDLYKSHLDLQNFCTVDTSLTGTAGMTRKINVYTATDSTETLAMGVGNTKSTEVSYTPKEYKILLAQNRFKYYDEQEMTDPMLIPVGTKQLAAGLFNKVNEDIYAEFNKATLTQDVDKLDFGAFADALSLLDVKGTDNDPSQISSKTFAFISPKDMANLRKSVGDDLKYVESFTRTGYVGTVAGVNVFTKKDATKGTIIIATNNAVTLFDKKGVEVEQSRDENTRENTIFSRKYYLAALTDTTQLVKLNFKGKSASSVGH